MSFIPQAIADPVSRSVLFVFPTEESFRPWRGKVSTIDAPGVRTHPRHIKAGDIVDWFPVGWNKAEVLSVRFVPDEHDIPDYHRSGTYEIHTPDGFISARVDGRLVVGSDLYIFPRNDKQ